MKKALQDRGMSQASLARALGVHPSTVTLLLRGTTKYSSLVPRICDLLNLPYPDEPVTSRELAEWVRIGRELSPELRNRIIAMLEAMLDESS